MLSDNYKCDGQMSIFDLLNKEESELNYTPIQYKIPKNKPIRLIETFAGIGSQAMALRDLGANLDNGNGGYGAYRVIEFDKYAIASYNAIHNSNFPTIDITTVHGADLGVVDTDKYEYILTYSFPCTDLSVAGAMKGMAEGSGTRSSLLWEVKRLLNECLELSQQNSRYGLPKILVMENVPQIHSKANMPHFQAFLDYLSSIGYSNFWKDMNAKNYGVAQSRNRTICVSILGNENYIFPDEIPLEKRMKDYLQDEVEERYYLNNEKAKNLIDKLILDGKILADRQTGIALTSATSKQKQSRLQIVSQQDTMPELSSTNTNTPVSANTPKLRGGTKSRLICQPTTPIALMSQTAFPHEPTEESASGEQRGQEFAELIRSDCHYAGSSQENNHQSGETFFTDACCPCESATQYKHPTRFIDVKKHE